MQSHRFPGEILIGPGTLARLAELSPRLGFTRVLLVSDPGLERAGIVERAVHALDAAGVTHHTFTEIRGEPTVAVVDQALEAARAFNPDGVVGIGGGSVLDVAKAVAALFTSGGDITAYWGNDRFTRPALKKVLIPTTAGTGSEVSQAVVFAERDHGVKKVANALALMADVAIVDAELTLSVPPRVTADSGMDALTHAVEAYLAKRASPLSDALAEAAVTLIGHHLLVAYRDGSDIAARDGMIQASMLAGMAFTSAGLGAVHALGYPLDTHFGVPHGRTNAVFLAAVLRFNRAFCEPKLRRLAALVGAPDDDFPAWIDGRLDALGIARQLRAYGVPREEATALAREGWESGQRLLGNSPREMAREDAERLYAALW